MNDLMIQLLEITIISPVIAIIAWAYCEVLTDSGMLLNRIYVYIDRCFPKWIAKPLMTCVYCCGGQMALWSYFYLVHTGLPYNLFTHIYYISITFVFIKILDKLWN